MGEACGPGAAEDRRAYLWCVFFYCAAWAILCSPWILETVTIPYDAKAHFQAQIQFLANALASGQSPFWNPHVFAGSPQIADPQSLIFSPALLLAWLNPAPSFRMVDGYVFALLGAGGLAAIALFREKAWSPHGAIVAALAFSFGASASSRVQHIGQIQSLCFFMIGLWLLVRLLRTGGVGAGCALGLASGLMVVEPDQPALLGAYLFLFVAVWEMARADRSWADLRRRAPGFGAAAACGLAVALAPVLLAWLFVEESTRPHIGFAEAAEGSLHPASLLTGVIADLFGALNPRVEYWGPFSAAWGPNEWALTQNMGQLYIGAIPALLLVARGGVMRQAWEPGVRLFTVGALLMTLYAFGAHTPFFKLLYHWAPGVDGFRRPADATFLMGALGALVAGYLTHRALSTSGKDALLKIAGGFRGALVLAALMALAAALAWRTHRFNDALPQIVIACGWLLCAFATLTIARRWREARPVVALGLLAAFATADLAINNGPNESTGLPPSVYRVLRPDSGNETVRVIKEALRRSAGPDRRDRVELVGVGFEWPNASLVYGFDNILGYNPLRLEAYSAATGARDNVAGWDQRKFSPLFPSYQSTLANLLGLRLIVSGAPVEKIDQRLQPGALRLIARTRDAWVYENPAALPRAMFVSDWRTADFEALIASGEWPDFNPQRTALLESEPERWAAKPSWDGKPAKVRIATYENTRIVVEVEADRPGLVVLNDVWHPWWTAQVNGEPVDILRANVLFRAVEVPAGRSSVVFEFSPMRGAVAELRERLFDAE